MAQTKDATKQKPTETVWAIFDTEFRTLAVSETYPKLKDAQYFADQMSKRTAPPAKIHPNDKTNYRQHRYIVIPVQFPVEVEK